eukprot:5490040-Prymnesium_polylepis.3
MAGCALRIWASLGRGFAINDGEAVARGYGGHEGHVCGVEYRVWEVASRVLPRFAGISAAGCAPFRATVARAERRSTVDPDTHLGVSSVRLKNDLRPLHHPTHDYLARSASETEKRAPSATDRSLLSCAIGERRTSIFRK